jgi:myosin heavy subunit
MRTVEDHSLQTSGGYLKNVALAVTILFLLAANVHLSLQLNRLRSDTSRLRNAMQAEIDTLRDAASVSAATAKRDLEFLKNELERARQQANLAVRQTRRVLFLRAEELARKLAEEQQKQQQVASELSAVKSVAIKADARISNVSGEVSSVRTAVASAKSEMQQTLSDLKRVNGELDMYGGMVATNANELAILKRLGQRDYFEFTIAKTKQPQLVGDIGLVLKKSDPTRNMYTVEVVADDKKTEKRDRSINEPVHFYVSRISQPYELVVNEVRKDQIIGYLATPKFSR